MHWSCCLVILLLHGEASHGDLGLHGSPGVLQVAQAVTLAKVRLPEPVLFSAADAAPAATGQGLSAQAEPGERAPDEALAALKDMGSDPAADDIIDDLGYCLQEQQHIVSKVLARLSCSSCCLAA